MKVLRKDVVLEPNPAGEGCTLRDPASGKSYDFGAVEAFLIEGLRSPWTAARLAAECNARHAADCSAADIDSFVRMVADWGLLEERRAATGEPDEAESVEPPTPEDPGFRCLVRESVGLDMLARAVRPLRCLALVIPALFCFGLAGVGGRMPQFLSDLGGVLSNPAALASIPFFVLLANLVIEAWRGASACASGAPLPAIGLRRQGWAPSVHVRIAGLDQLDPAARFRVAAAPLIAACAYAGLCSLLWVASARSHAVFMSGVWAVGVVISMAAVVAVSNPFSPSGLWSLFRTATGRGEGPAPMPPGVPRVLGLLLWVFAFAAAAATFIALYLQLEAGIRGGGLVAVFLAAGGMAYAMKKPAESVIERHRARAASKAPGAAGTPPGPRPASATVEQPDRRRRIKIALAAAAVVILFLPYPFHVGGEAEVLPAQRATLTAEMDGMIEEIFFDSGDYVTAGTVVAQMANHRQIRDLRAAEAGRDAIAFDIAKLRSTPTPEEVAAATTKVDSAKVAARYTADELKRASVLYERGSSSTQELDKARQAADAAVQGLAEAEANLAAVKAQVNPNQIAALEAVRIKMEHEIVMNKEQLRRTSLITPISGRIVTKDLQYKLKSFVKEGIEFAVVEDLNTVLIQVAVPEPEIGDVKVGASMKLRLWAFPDEEFEGTVEQILPAAEETTADMGRTVPVIGRMDNSDGQLRSGLTGQAKIRGEPRLVIVAFTKAIVRFVLIELWSWFP
jgi:putative peptide zinc metalloprotease protein